MSHHVPVQKSWKPPSAPEILERVRIVNCMKYTNDATVIFYNLRTDLNDN